MKRPMKVLREESTLSPEFNPHAHFEPWCKKMVTELWFVGGASAH